MPAQKQRNKPGRFNNDRIGVVEHALRERAAGKRRARQKKVIYDLVVTHAAPDMSWCEAVKQMMLDYAYSLVYKDGSPPEGLRGAPLQRVQFKFALTCVLNRVRPGSLPGMEQSWYLEMEDAARRAR